MSRKQLMKWLTLVLGPPIGAAYLRLLSKTMRLRRKNFDTVEELSRQGKSVIYAFWHGRQLMMPLAYSGRAGYALISQHRDGDLIQRIIARFGIGAVRGSTTRGGATALRQLIELGRAGADLGVTPDGPQGPRHVAQVGVVQLAKVTGLPIVPVTFSSSKKKSSRAGTGSSYRIRSAGDCSSWGNRSGWPRTRLRRISSGRECPWKSP